MSGEISPSMSTVWTTLEGQVTSGGLPLHRCIASSTHSGVFITESAQQAASAVVLKLVRADAAFADAQLSRWVATAALSHPHLIRIFDAGRCRVGELHCLYALMERADQNLAQLLEQRTLDADDMREMLPPTLSALAYLHEKKFVQGQLQPSNILAVGDQLKLASDTVRAVGDSAGGMHTGSGYDAPEARDGICSAAGDIWALGVTMCEALARRQPSGLLSGKGKVELPPDLYPPFREIVARCLAKNPRDRPGAAELQAWLRGERAVGAPLSTTSERTSDQPASSQRSVAQTAAVKPMDSQASSVAPVEPQSSKPSTFRLVIRAEIIPDDAPRTAARQPLNRRALLLALGAVAVLLLIWIGAHVFRTDPASTSAASDAAREVESPLPVPAPRETAPAVSTESPPKSATSTTEAKTPAAEPVGSKAQGEADAALTTSHEVIPTVPQSARQTIRGTIRVSVRVSVDTEGKVVAATADDRGPSRYFERLALEAARKWTFAPAGARKRTVLVRFNFTREGTTASASPLQ